jgi:HEPN domain-containing protein
MTLFDMVKEGLRYAASDLRTARHLFEELSPKEIEIPAWHSLQCMENALKAFLVAHDIDPPKTHDLEQLADLCKAIDGSFTEIEIDCKKINHYSDASRYPGEIVIDEIIVKALIERAQRVYDFCGAKINLLFNQG